MLYQIFAGYLRGRKVFSETKVAVTHPALRKSLFDMVQSFCKKKRWLDLYSGSGSIGFEAWSRGAVEVICVDNNKFCINLMQTFLKALEEERHDLGELGHMRVENADSILMIKALAQQKECFDVVFLHPPAHRGVIKKALKTLGAYDILAANSLVICVLEESDRLPDLKGQFEIFKEKSFAQQNLWILRRL